MRWLAIAYGWNGHSGKETLCSVRRNKTAPCVLFPLSPGQQKQFEEKSMTTPKLWKNHSAPMPSKTPKVQPHCSDGKVSVRIGFFSWFIKMMFCTFCHLPVVALPTGWISKSCQTNTWHGVMTQQPLEVILILNTMLKKTIKQKTVKTMILFSVD